MRGLASHALVLAVLAGGVGAAHAAPPDLDAVVTYETRQTLSSGALRTETWKERLVRRGDTVWTERVLPAQARHVHEAPGEHAGHKHFNADSAARWIQLDATGQTQLRYVDREQRTVVSVPKTEYGAVGFDGRFDAAAHIVPPSLVARMPAQAGPAGAGGVWHVETDKDWSHRVLWSEARQMALRVESRRIDGSVSRVVTVEPAPAPAALPWQAVSGYTQKEYDDFMD